MGRALEVPGVHGTDLQRALIPMGVVYVLPHTHTSGGGGSSGILPRSNFGLVHKESAAWVLGGVRGLSLGLTRTGVEGERGLDEGLGRETLELGKAGRGASAWGATPNGEGLKAEAPAGGRVPNWDSDEVNPSGGGCGPVPVVVFCWKKLEGGCWGGGNEGVSVPKGACAGGALGVGTFTPNNIVVCCPVLLLDAWGSKKALPCGPNGWFCAVGAGAAGAGDGA